MTATTSALHRICRDGVHFSMNDQNYNYMVTFAKKCRHRGGGSGEEILVEFGLSQSEYFRQLHSLLGRRIGAAADLPDDIHRELTAICRRRLSRRPVSADRISPLHATSDPI